MLLRWSTFIVCFGAFASLIVADSAGSKLNYGHQPAPNFLFEQRPFRMGCSDRPVSLPPGTTGVMVLGNQAPYARTRLETLNLSLAEVPALTIAAEPINFIHIEGANQSSWALQFCAVGEGDSEEEARGYRDSISMSRTGSLLRLSDARAEGRTGGKGELIAQAPKDAPLMIHAVGAVELRNMSGPVWITATGGRATILNTTGLVNAQGEVVDFAGARGHVMLNAESEIDIKLTGPRFMGTLSAYARREVRVLVPHGFESPIEIMVNRPGNFVCRADMCSAMQRDKENGLTVFKYPGSGNAPTERISLRSDQSTVVIDNWRESRFH